jgi:hypothetical protein
VLWERLASQPLWVFLGIIANGYIVGGIAAAALVFYREGLRDWLALVARARDGQSRGNMVQ